MQYKQPSLQTIFHIYKTISYVLDAHSQTSNALAKTWHCTVHCSIICSFYYNAQSLSMLECVGASVCMLSARVCALRTKHCANRQTRYSSSRWKYCVVVYACSLCSAIINCLRWCWLAMMPNHRNASPTTVGQHIIFSIHFTRRFTVSIWTGVDMPVAFIIILVFRSNCVMILATGVPTPHASVCMRDAFFISCEALKGLFNGMKNTELMKWLALPRAPAT